MNSLTPEVRADLVVRTKAHILKGEPLPEIGKRLGECLRVDFRVADYADQADELIHDASEQLKTLAEPAAPTPPNGHAAPQEAEAVKQATPVSIAPAPITAPIVGGVPAALAKDIAAKMIRLGSHVIFFPRGQKATRESGWQNEATRDMGAVERITAAVPFANVGVVGKLDGNWFFDDDGAVLAEYEAQYGRILTYRVRSVSGGTHLHLKQNDASRAMGNINGVDANGKETWSARVLNRYVVAPGSSAHPNNDPNQSEAFYLVIDDVPVIEAPASFIEFLKARVGKKESAKKENTKIEEKFVVRKGGRNNWLTSQVGKAHQLGLDGEELLSYARRLNAKHCEPPLPDEEVQTIVQSVAKYEVKQTDLVMNQQAQPVTTETPTEWPAVTPLDDLLSPVLPFELNFLPASIQPWVKDVSERMGVPLDFAGICALVTLAGVVGRRVFVYPKEFDKEWKESICLSGAVAAHSGKTKTPTWKTFTNVVVEMEMDWKREHSRKMGQYLADRETWEENQKANKRTKEKTPNASVIEVEPQKPAPCRCVVVNDATPEALHATMEENPEGLLYYRDELSGWVAELDKDGREGQRELFLDAMNGNDPHAMKRIGRGNVFAIMCLSVFGGFQPDMLVDFLSESRNIASGLIPRFTLMAWPDELEILAIDRAANDGAKQQFRSVVRTLMEMKVESIFMHFNPEAQRIFNQWFADHNQKTNKEENTGKQSHLAKYKGALPKIAALLQLVDMVALGGIFTGNHLIDAEHIRKAIAFLVYLESHMHRVYDSRREGLQQAKNLLAKRIKKGALKDGMSVREIQLKHWHGLDNADRIEGALMSLAEHGWVREAAPSNRPGRPTVRWEINPAVKPNS